MDQNQLNNLRDIAQAAHNLEANRIARETAAATSELLRSQEQQRALEQQRLAVERERLQEERKRHEASQNKLELQKAIRKAMATMERELQSLARDLGAGRFNGVIAGVPLASFVGVLVQRRLKELSEAESNLDDLSDIRFVGSLHQAFEDLVAKYPLVLGPQVMSNAVRKLADLASWAGKSGKEVELLEDSAFGFLLDLRSDTKESNSLMKIQTHQQRVVKDRQTLEEIESALVSGWIVPSGELQTLSDAGVRREEIEFILEKNIQPDLAGFQDELSAARHDLDQCEKILKENEAAWHSDKTLFEKALGEVNAGHFVDAERTDKGIFSREWTDLDTTQVTRALESERDRLLLEVDALLPYRKKEAAVLAEKHSQAHAGSVIIGESLSHRHSVIVAELKAEKEARARKTNMCVALAALAVLASVLVGLKRKSIAERTEKERIAASEKAERERIAAAERTEKERIAAAEEKARVRREAVLAGKMLLDQGGRALLLVPSGNFEMGAGDESGNPVHSVNVSKFFIGETEVTYGEWEIVFGWARGKGYDFKSGNGDSHKHPVTNVSWYDAVKWCNAKSEMEGLVPCYKASGNIYRKGEEDKVACDWKAGGYRLPTEAEWEKAARGGQSGKKFPNGDILEKKDANFGGGGTVEAGKYPENGYGLRDMAGNVWEWCWDWYGEYDKKKTSDATGPDAGEYRVLRGGSWYNEVQSCRVSYRDYFRPNISNGSRGIRLVRRSGL